MAPVYPQADIAYRRIKQFLTPGSFVPFASPWPRIEIPISGTTIWIKSADNPDSLYGEDVYGAVLDEASRAKEEAWHALRSTLTATRGPCRLIGNVKGRRNFFYSLARRAEKGELPNWHYAKIVAQDAVDAGVLDPAEIEDARLTLPEAVFRELYLAEASDDEGNPFGLAHIQKCLAPLSSLPPVAFGIDLAKKKDYLVVLGLDSNGYVCHFSRWRDVPWRDSIRRIHSIVGDDTPTLVDSTGVGDPVLEELQHEHSNFSGFNFSMNGKQKLMEGLAVSIQGQEIHFPGGVMQQELENFQYEITRTGVRYSAPEGHYDDCVCALALARQVWVEKSPGQTFMTYLAEELGRQKEETTRETEAEDRSSGLLPWRTSDLSASEILDNELNQFYQQTVAGLSAPAHRLCFRCHSPVAGPARISDGFHVWHQGCI